MSDINISIQDIKGSINYTYLLIKKKKKILNTV